MNPLKVIENIKSIFAESAKDAPRRLSRMLTVDFVINGEHTWAFP